MLELRLESGLITTPVYEQIAVQITRLITNGRLLKGDFLPPTRDLARQLGVSRGSVVRAYEQLCASGVCQGHVGKGTEVIHSQAPQEKSQTGTGYFLKEDDDLTGAFCSDTLSLLPSHASTDHLPIGEFRSAFNRVLRYPDKLNRFSESRGNGNLRRLICDRLLPVRGITASPSEILVVPGTQYASVLLAMTLMRSRSVFHFGSPGYMDFAHNFSRFGYRLQSHEIDSEGVSADELQGTDKDILYLMPEHHFPQCVTMSQARRETFLRLAVQKKVLLLEDDYDSEFYYDRAPMPALRSSSSPDNVIYMGTFSKVLFNSIRLGYLVAERDLVDQMASLHWELSRGTSGLVQQWVGELIDSGAYARHAKRMRTVYLHKRERVSWLIRKLLPAAQLKVPDGGLQMYLSFADARVTEKVFLWLRENNVQIASFNRYMYTGDRQLNIIVLGYANVDLKRLEKLLQRLQLFLEK